MDLKTEERSSTTTVPVPAEGELLRLELGSGQRPSPGYVHNDRNAFPGIEFVCNPWEIDLPAGSVVEVLALGVIEHLTYDEARKTFAKVNELLAPRGEFLFDVPDIPVWCRYVHDWSEGRPTPFPIEHLLATLYGWQRWPGDEHRSGWYQELVAKEVADAGFTGLEHGVEIFTDRGIVRNRMTRPADAHIYCRATKD